MLETAVDGIEDAKASQFQNVQSLSIGSPQLLETESIENRRFGQNAGTCVGLCQTALIDSTA